MKNMRLINCEKKHNRDQCLSKGMHVEMQAMENVLECRNVTKRYGKKTALDQLSLTIPTGRIVGLLGPNGAGKTTLMKLIVTLLRDYKGSLTVSGIRPGLKTKKWCLICRTVNSCIHGCRLKRALLF